MTLIKTKRQHRLTLSPQAICKLLKWDSFGVNNIQPRDLKSVQLCGDILQFHTADRRMLLLAVSQVFEYARNLKSTHAPIVVEWEGSDEVWGGEQGYTYNLANGNRYRFFVYHNDDGTTRIDCLDPGSRYRGKSKHSTAVGLALQNKGVALPSSLWDDLKQDLLSETRN